MVAAPIVIPAIPPVERPLDFPGDTTTVVCVGVALAEDVVEDEDVADGVEGELVGRPSGEKYSPGTNAWVAFNANAC
jgi:hypothetical protein